MPSVVAVAPRRAVGMPIASFTDYSKWDNIKDIKDSCDDGAGQVGGLYPAELQEDAQTPAKAVGEEMLSRVFSNGAEAADFILMVMQNDPREEVQAMGCRALSQIAEKPAGRAALRSHCGVEVIVASMMSATAGEVAVQAHGCSALANLAIGEGADDDVVAKSGLDAVLAAAKSHLGEVTVQRKACLALGNLAYGSAGEAKVLATGGLEAVVAAMQTHAKDIAVQEEGVDALINIADSAKGKQQLLELGGVPVLAAAQERAPRCAAAAEDFRRQLLEQSKV